MKAERPTIYENINYLRIISALLIVFCHYQQNFKIRFDGFNFFNGPINFGMIVELFFIISGFLAANGLNRSSVIKNIFHKWIRIFPYAFIATGFCCFLLFVFPNAFDEIGIMTDTSAIRIITSLLLVHQGWIIEFAPAINNPTWYLCVLIWIYIIFYSIEAIDRKINFGSKKVAIYFVFILLGIVGRKVSKYHIPFIHEHDCRGYLAFFSGVILHRFIIKNSERTQIVSGIIAIAIGIVGFFIKKAPYVFEIVFLLGIVSAFISLPQKSNKIIRELGNTSFEVYLWHVPLIMLSQLVVFSKTEINHSYFSMIVFGIIVEIFSFIIYKAIEKPLTTKFREFEEKI